MADNDRARGQLPSKGTMTEQGDDDRAEGTMAEQGDDDRAGKQ